MIRALRSRHRGAIVALAIALPIVFGLGLAVRRPVPANVALPHALAAPAFDEADVLVSQRQEQPGGVGLVVRRLKPVAAGAPERLFVEITADPHLPELLAYWAPGAGSAASLPANANLLGPLSPVVPALYELPPASDGPGRLILYCLAQARVVETVPLRSGADR